MSDLKNAHIVSARERGLISPETMAAAVRCEPRAIAYTQWKLDGNDGPASPPEGWQAEVTVDVELTKKFWSLEIQADIPGWECRSSLSKEMDGLDSLRLWFGVIGKVCERAAFNVRREGSK